METRCFKCNRLGHISSQCPSRALHIGKFEKENLKNSLGDQEVYITDTKLAKAYEESSTLEEVDPKKRLDIIRCILAQPKESEH